MAQAPLELAPEAGASAPASSLQAAGPRSPVVNAPTLRDRPPQARALQVVKGMSPGLGELHSLRMDGEPSAEELLGAVQAGFRATRKRRFVKGVTCQRQVVSVARLSSVTQMLDDTRLLQNPVVGFHHAVLSEQLTRAFRKPEVLRSLTLTDILAENEVLLVEWKVDWVRLGMTRTALSVALALVGGLGSAGVLQM